VDVVDAINTRRSVRKYTTHPVEWDNVLQILEAAQMAPSAGNLQNWRFVLIVDPDKRMEIAEACLQQYWIAQAPLIIVCFALPDKVDRYYGERGATLYTTQGMGAAIQNMLLVSRDLGLGSCWVGAFDDQMLSRSVGAATEAQPQAVLTIGYADENPEPPPRYDLKVTTRFNSYGGRFADMVDANGEYSVYVGKALKRAKELFAALQNKLKTPPKG